MERVIGSELLSNLKLEDINGERQIEREYTLYVEVVDLAFLDNAATMELHEQWSLRYATGKVKGRLRLINNRRYTEAIKQKIVGTLGSYECEQDITPDMYEMKKLGSDSGYLKERYTFPIDGTNLKWEVDVFKNKAGVRSKWVKVDLEFNSVNDAIPELPFEVNGDRLFVSDDETSQEVKDFIASLWSEEWAALSHNSARGGVIK